MLDASAPMDITLYSAKGSNSSARVEWVLDYKEVSYHRVEIGNHALKTSYLALNPYGYVPSVSINGTLIAESMAIIECLEELFPHKPVLGGNVLERAKVREMCEYVNSSIHSPQNRTALNFFKPGILEAEKRKLRGDWITQCLYKLESQLWKHSQFAQGQSFTAADIFVICMYKKGLQHGIHSIDSYQIYSDQICCLYR